MTQPTGAPGPRPNQPAAGETPGETVHRRLALLSCAIWTLGVFAVYVAAPAPRRDAWTMAAAVLLLLVAAAPWLLRGRWTAAEAARRQARGAPEPRR